MVALLSALAGVAAATPATVAPPSVAAPRTLEPPPKVGRIHAEFRPATQSTVYTINVDSRRFGIRWFLDPPADDATCRRADAFGNEMEWRHGEKDGCTHIGTQHNGVVSVKITSGNWTCELVYEGTLTGDGPPAVCRRDCRDLEQRIALLRGKIDVLTKEIPSLVRLIDRAERGLSQVERRIQAARTGLSAAFLQGLGITTQEMDDTAREAFRASAAMHDARSKLEGAKLQIAKLKKQLEEALADLEDCGKPRIGELRILSGAAGRPAAALACEAERTKAGTEAGRAAGYAELQRQVPRARVEQGLRAAQRAAVLLTGIQKKLARAKGAERAARDLAAALAALEQGTAALEGALRALDAVRAKGAQAKKAAAAAQATLAACEKAAG